MRKSGFCRVMVLFITFLLILVINPVDHLDRF